MSATVVSTFLGTGSAYAIHRYKTRLQKVQAGLIWSPLFIPDILMGISLVILFVVLNIKLGLFTIFLAHTTFCISYVTLVILSRLQNFDFSVIEAARDLGANGFQVTRKVFIPMIAPAIIAAALLAFTLSIDDFVVTYFVTGPGSGTLPIYIYGMIKYGSTPIINALSCLILLVTFITVFLTQYFSGDYKS
ncbi:ABC transporter permease [Chlamydiales bacterium]|nr:ABC transporter permease [Chlamydiales bacterium]